MPMVVTIHTLRNIEDCIVHEKIYVFGSHYSLTLIPCKRMVDRNMQKIHCLSA